MMAKIPRTSGTPMPRETGDLSDRSYVLHMDFQGSAEIRRSRHAYLAPGTGQTGPGGPPSGAEPLYELFGEHSDGPPAPVLACLLS